MGRWHKLQVLSQFDFCRRTEQNLSVDVTMANQVPRKLNRMVDTIESL